MAGALWLCNLRDPVAFIVACLLAKQLVVVPNRPSSSPVQLRRSARGMKAGEDCLHTLRKLGQPGVLTISVKQDSG